MTKKPDEFDYPADCPHEDCNRELHNSVSMRTHLIKAHDSYGL